MAVDGPANASAAHDALELAHHLESLGHWDEALRLREDIVLPLLSAAKDKESLVVEQANLAVSWLIRGTRLLEARRLLEAAARDSRESGLPLGAAILRLIELTQGSDQPGGLP
ncbi:hypothetical protein HZA57_03980 [Candidatus Poribacteria bacterium]|nr:hypothetical protein [Candidatus Poribacteria bacterium]